MKTDKDTIRKNLIHDTSLKKLAICIPTYNRSNLLNRLLKSIPSIDDIMISQKAFIERLQNFDLEFWIHKG